MYYYSSAYPFIFDNAYCQSSSHVKQLNTAERFILFDFKETDPKNSVVMSFREIMSASKALDTLGEVVMDMPGGWKD